MINNNEHFDFHVNHSSFYNEFEKWRKTKNEESEIKEGIYYLLAGKSVPRCLGEDEDGILYIGKGIILDPLHRLGKLINAINETEELHEAGKRYNSHLFKKKYPLEDVRLRVVLTNDSREREKECLAAYVAKFGELPPLNHQL
jgi:hypothetical protein